MTDNFKLIEPLLHFPHKDSFYFIQILQRKKDHSGERLGGSNNNSRLIKAYYVTSVEKLEIYREEMIKLAEVFNARVSINLNPRSFRKAAFHCLQRLANQMSNDNYHDAPKAYNSVCGEYHSEIDKRWIVDVDKDDLCEVDNIIHFINGLHTLIENKEYKVIASIPSKTGMHIITNPFNSETFNQYYPSIETHRNNPTNLYIP